MTDEQQVIEAGRKVQSGGTFTPRDIKQIAAENGVSFRQTCWWLEVAHVLPCGTYRRLKHSTFVKTAEWGKWAATVPAAPIDDIR